MSSAGNWTYINDVTVWKVTIDEYSRPVYSAPYIIKCDYFSGGKVERDSTGAEFIPTSTYFFEAAVGSALVPRIDDYIKIGDNRSSPNPVLINAERVRLIGHWPMGAFGDGELPDWRLLT